MIGVIGKLKSNHLNGIFLSMLKGQYSVVTKKYINSVVIKIHKLKITDGL